MGKVLNYFSNVEVAHILMESNEIKINDNILIMGESTGVIEMSIESMKVFDVDSTSAKRGDELTMKIPSAVRRNDKIYLIEHIK